MIFSRTGRRKNAAAQNLKYKLHLLVRTSNSHLYQKQIASTIATFLGHNFTANHPVAKSIDLMDAHN